MKTMKTTLLDKGRIKKQLVQVLDMDEIVADKIVSATTKDLNLIRIISPIDFLDHCNSVLPPDEKILRTLFFLTTLESIVASKKTNKQKANLVTSAILKHLSSEEKGKLLGGFLFTDTYKFGEGKLGARHLMFQDVISDQNFNKFESANSKYCSTSDPYLCRCVEWINKKGNYDLYIPNLIARLNEMRAAVLHEVFRTYESGLESKEFVGWIKKIIIGSLKEKVGI